MSQEKQSAAKEQAFPEPTLIYAFWGNRTTRDLDVVTTDAIRLYSLDQVTVARSRDGSMYAYLRGKMRKRDGQPSAQSRSILVAPEHDQPLWLKQLFVDAGRRLGVRVPPKTGANR